MVQNTKGNRPCGSMQEKLLDHDLFGQHFNFKMPGGKDFYATGCGVMFSIILLVILVFYGSIQMHSLYWYDDTKVLTSVNDAYYADDYVFSSTDGFEIAFAITAFDTNRDPIEDARYGTLRA